MPRALLLILDSVGVGGAPDAAEYGDAGADTLGHIREQLPALSLPNLDALGLAKIARSDAHRRPVHTQVPAASFGRMRERSAGKDTTTGHWEITGAVLEQPFATFPSFPAELVNAIERDARVSFIGNYARSGTAILEELGPEHLRSAWPILYTSADSVLQIAAHEEIVPLERLYQICRVARAHCDRWRIGRVIARPFLGTPGNFRRTAGRHDFSMRPPRTVLNALSEAGHEVTGIGKINDIFASTGITHSHPTSSNRDGMCTIEHLWRECRAGLLFANLVDFDTLFGHRRDVAGYGEALEQFDLWLGNFLPRVQRDDLVIITADHGNDPTFRGTDHTREEVPLLVLHGEGGAQLGTRTTYADVAATLAEYFELGEAWEAGESFLEPCACSRGEQPAACR